MMVIPKQWKNSNNTSNIISYLKMNGHTINCPTKILSVFKSNFEEIYQQKPGSDSSKLIEKFCVSNQVDSDIEVGGEITVSEVRKAIRKLNCKKAPGADGLTSNYYRAFIRELSPVLCLVYNDAIIEGCLPPSQCLSIIKLLPEKKISDHLKDFRPINLLNTDVKILSHILTERVKNALNKIINPYQFAYLSQRNIHSAIHIIKKKVKKLNRSSCLVSIDFSKAFDKINRNYLYELLTALNFMK